MRVLEPVDGSCSHHVAADRVGLGHVPDVLPDGNTPLTRSDRLRRQR